MSASPKHLLSTILTANNLLNKVHRNVELLTNTKSLNCMRVLFKVNWRLNNTNKAEVTKRGTKNQWKVFRRQFSIYVFLFPEKHLLTKPGRMSQE